MPERRELGVQAFRDMASSPAVLPVVRYRRGSASAAGADSFCSEENEHGSRQICLIAHRDAIAGLTKNAVAGM